MTWLVFALSGLLTVLGVASVISGAPIIQIERGWAEVIAGSVAVAGGIVTFALAAIHWQVRTIRRAIVERSVGAVSPLPQLAPVAVPAPLELRRTIDETPPAIPPAPADLGPSVLEPVEADPEPATAAPDVRQGLWKRIRDMGETRDEAVDVPSERPFSPADLVSVISVSPPDLPESAPAVMIHDEEHARPAPDVRHPAAPDGFDASDALPRRNLMTAEDDSGSIDWLDRGLQSARPARPSFLDEPRITPVQSLEPADIGIETERVAEAPALDRDASDDHREPATDETGAVEPRADGVTVIGRYQAGVASYVMYSDGTIEVESESGAIRRFDSMEHLKAFIAQQDTPAL